MTRTNNSAESDKNAAYDPRCVYFCAIPSPLIWDAYASAQEVGAKGRRLRSEFDYHDRVGENNFASVIASSKWACGAAGSALPWHGRGRRFDPDQVHQTINNLVDPPVVDPQAVELFPCVLKVRDAVDDEDITPILML